MSPLPGLRVRVEVVAAALLQICRPYGLGGRPNVATSERRHIERRHIGMTL